MTYLPSGPDQSLRDYLRSRSNPEFEYGKNTRPMCEMFAVVTLLTLFTTFLVF